MITLLNSTTFLLGIGLAFYIPSSSIYLASLWKEFSFSEHILSHLSTREETKKLFNKAILIASILMTLYFFFLFRSLSIKLTTLIPLLAFASFFFLFIMTFFPYETKDKKNYYFHNITAILFGVLFLTSIVFLQIRLFPHNPYMMILSLSITIASVLIGSLLFIKEQKPNAIMEFILIFLMSWWIIFFSVGQFFIT